MDIFVGAVIVLVGWGVKKLTSTFGYDYGRAITIIVAFALSAVASIVYNTVDKTFWQEVAKLFAVQMAIYEVAYKSVLKPLLDK